MVDLQFAGSALHYLFFDGALCDETVDDHLFSLPNPVRTIHGLKIDLRVPVTVEENNDVSFMQVDAQTTCSGGEDKNLLVGGWRLEVFNPDLTVVSSGLAVDAAVLVAAIPQEVVQYIEQSRHLAENKDFKVLSDQLRQQQVQDLELLARGDEVVSVDEGRAGLNVVK